MDTATVSCSDAGLLKRKNSSHDEFDSKPSSSSHCAPLEPKNPCLEDISLTAVPFIKTALTKSSAHGKVSKHVRFDTVQVYLFERSQGFTCVPSQGGSTLGMASSHWTSFRFSTTQHLALCAKKRRRQLWRQHCAGKVALPPQVLARLELLFEKEQHKNDEEDEEEETLSCVEEEDVEGLEELYFVQPVSIRQRRAMLRQAGVTRIDADERARCQAIRASRELCGCSCVSVCFPDSCLCALEGISCQVDRLNFPCACARESCSNPVGRSEFNPLRVRTHYAHTQLRLSNSTSTAVQSAQLLNSTERGACRDCQDEKYLDLLKSSSSSSSLVMVERSDNFTAATNETAQTTDLSTEAPLNHKAGGVDNEVERFDECDGDYDDDEEEEEEDTDIDENVGVVDAHAFKKNHTLLKSNLDLSNSSYTQHHATVNCGSALVYKLDPINTLFNHSNHYQQQQQQHLQPPNCMPLGWPPAALSAAMITPYYHYPPQQIEHQTTLASPVVEKIELTDLTPLQPVDRSQLLASYYNASNTVIPIKPVMVACAEELKRFIPTGMVCVKSSQNVDALSIAVLPPSTSFEGNDSNSNGNISPSFGEILKKSICETSVSA